MYIYGVFTRKADAGSQPLDLQHSTDLTPEILQRAADDPDFQIINTRTLRYYVPDELLPDWVEIEPNLDI